MTTRADLLALADRVEREEPSAALLRDIARGLGWTCVEIVSWKDTSGRYHVSLPEWLHSLDAAASLEKPHWGVGVDKNSDDPVYVRIVVSGATLVATCAPTEPQARTAAALRAMAQELQT